jgi:hypothetical protein
MPPKPIPLEQLPSAPTLRRATAIAALVAAFLGVAVVLPAERGIDPTGIGNVLGLTVMGQFKMEAKRAFAVAAERIRRDSVARAADPDWGEPVQGVQLHVEVSPEPHEPTELPILLGRIRNQGAETVRYRPEAIAWGEIEIDGVWYGVTRAVNGSVMASDLAPNGVSQPASIRIDRRHLFGGGLPSGSVNISPGPHRVRIRTSGSGHLGIGTPTHALGGPPFGPEEFAGLRQLQLVSNTVVVEVR